MGCIYININWEFFLASTALAASFFAIYTQRKHNKLSFKPIPVLIRYNYLNTLRVRIWNKGTGPLIINSISAEKNGVVKASLKAHMPPQPKGIYYVEYISDFEKRAISPGDSIRMLEFKNRNDNYTQYFNEVKNALNDITVTMNYENIYGDKETITFKTLSFPITKDEEYSNSENN